MPPRGAGCGVADGPPWLPTRSLLKSSCGAVTISTGSGALGGRTGAAVNHVATLTATVTPTRSPADRRLTGPDLGSRTRDRRRALLAIGQVETLADQGAWDTPRLPHSVAYNSRPPWVSLTLRIPPSGTPNSSRAPRRGNRLDQLTGFRVAHHSSGSDRSGKGDPHLAPSPHDDHCCEFSFRGAETDGCPVGLLLAVHLHCLPLSTGCTQDMQ